MWQSFHKAKFYDKYKGVHTGENFTSDAQKLQLHTGVNLLITIIIIHVFNKEEEIKQEEHPCIWNKIGPYKCSLCDKAFTKESILVKHMRVHTEENMYKCGYCDITF